MNRALELEEIWRSSLLAKANGEAKPLLANAITALREAPPWKGVIGFDAFGLSTMVISAPPWVCGSNSFAKRQWSHRDDALTTDWLQHHGIGVGLDVARQAVETVAHDNEFHPLRDYLDGLEWDETRRTNNWLTNYLGADDSPYTRAVGEAFLISAVARIYRPGVKAD